MNEINNKNEIIEQGNLNLDIKDNLEDILSDLELEDALMTEEAEDSLLNDMDINDRDDIKESFAKKDKTGNNDFSFIENDLEKNNEKHIRFDNCCYKQGELEKFPDICGTCGPTSVANALNIVTESDEYSEQSALEVCIDKNLCDLSPLDPDERGGTDTNDICDLIEELTEPEDHIQVEVFEELNALTPEELAEKLDDPHTVGIVGVKADILWGLQEGFSIDSTDHWITVESAYYDINHNVEGFHIVDSGGNMDYVDRETFEKASIGGFDNVILDKVAVIVSKDYGSIENILDTEKGGKIDDENFV